jgi:multiple sugar transport system permease protein
LVIFLAAKTAIKEPKRSSALVRRETFASYCFLLPSLIFFLGFVIYPMILCRFESCSGHHVRGLRK